MTTTLNDMEIGVSKCCGAKVYENGMCADCKEVCDVDDRAVPTLNDTLTEEDDTQVIYDGHE